MTGIPFAPPRIPADGFSVGDQIFVPERVSIKPDARKSPAVFHVSNDRNRLVARHAESGETFPLYQLLGGIPPDCDLIIAKRILREFVPGFYIRHVAGDSSFAFVMQQHDTQGVLTSYFVYKKTGKAEEICAFKNKESRKLFRPLSGEELRAAMSTEFEPGITPPDVPFEDLESVWKWIHDNPREVFYPLSVDISA